MVVMRLWTELGSGAVVGCVCAAAAGGGGGELLVVDREGHPVNSTSQCCICFISYDSPCACYGA